MEGDRHHYLVTNVYGPQRIDDKLKFLDSLEDPRDRHIGIPWIMGGDFNVIKSFSDKKGGMRIINKDSLEFQKFIDKMNLVKAEMNIGLFTWNNKRGGDSQVASRLKIYGSPTQISSTISKIGGKKTYRFKEQEFFFCIKH